VTDAAVARGEACLDAVDRARRDRFTHVDARDHLVASRGLLADALEECGYSLGEIERGEKGKPRLVDGPEFNLSHSNGVVVVAMETTESDTAIGVDVEAPWRTTDYDAVAGRFFAPIESVALSKLPDDERRRRFFELWTMKEAVLKATAKGLTQPLSSVVFRLDEQWTLESALAGAWSFRQNTLPTGHIVAGAALNETATDIDWAVLCELA
jgi:4'-phosphopantetheinyl transferase